MESDLSDRIANKCLEVYDLLGKNGKPQHGKEWTQLAGIVLERDGKLRVISLATGTKCIGMHSMCPEGTVINDSHAEVLARRAFIQFMLNEIKMVKDGGYSEIVKQKAQKFVIFENLKWHMYTSHVPCGDASIIPMEEIEELPPCSKRQKIDVHRTGAKPLLCESKQDSKVKGQNYHTRGAVRTKPGRGDRTMSLSCSDKIARWIYVGLQGALLSHLLEGAIKLTSIVIGAGGPFCHNIISNALIGRSGVEKSIPTILQAHVDFCEVRSLNKEGKPTPTSIIWSDVLNKPSDVISRGRRLGTTLKSIEKGIVPVAKRELLKQFLLLCPENLKKLTYKEIKEQAFEYQSLSKVFKQKMGVWSEKPPLENFVVIT